MKKPPKARSTPEVETSLELAVERLAAHLYRFAKANPSEPVDPELVARALSAARRCIVDIFDPFMVAFLASPELSQAHFKGMQRRSRLSVTNDAQMRNEEFRRWYQAEGKSFGSKDAAVSEFVKRNLQRYGWSPATAPTAALRKAIQGVNADMER